MLENSLDEELDNNCRYVVKRLTNSCENLLSLYANRLEVQLNLFDFIQNDIEVRIESVKISLEKLQIELNDQIDIIKANLNKKFVSLEKKFYKNSNDLKINLETKRGINNLNLSIRIVPHQKIPNLDERLIIGWLSKFDIDSFDLTKFDIRYKPSHFQLDFNLLDIEEYLNEASSSTHTAQAMTFDLLYLYK